MALDLYIPSPSKWHSDVADQAAMLALTLYDHTSNPTGIMPGQWVGRLDLDEAWQLVGTDPSLLASWKEWPYPVGVAELNAAIAQEVIDRNTAIANAVVGLWDDRGNFDASGGVFPTTGGSGTGGAILKGDVWTVSVAGTLGGAAVDVGDIVRALVDSPGNTAANWAVGETNVQQATEAMRGTLKVATQATVEDNTTTNDTDAVTPRKWWQAWAIGLNLSAFFAAVRGTLLTGYTVGADTAITASDSIRTAFGKTQGQINGRLQKSQNLNDLDNKRTARSNLVSDIAEPMMWGLIAATDGSEPGSGEIKRDNLTSASVTVIQINNQDITAANQSAILALRTNGILRLRSLQRWDLFADFYIGGVTAQIDSYAFAVQFLAGTEPLIGPVRVDFLSGQGQRDPRDVTMEGTIAAGTRVMFTATSHGWITGLRNLKTTSGSTDVTIKINGTAVTGLIAVTANTTASNPDATAANTYAPGDEITLTTTAGSTPQGLSFTIDCVRM